MDCSSIGNYFKRKSEGCRGVEGGRVCEWLSRELYLRGDGDMEVFFSRRFADFAEFLTNAPMIGPGRAGQVGGIRVDGLELACATATGLDGVESTGNSF